MISQKVIIEEEQHEGKKDINELNEEEFRNLQEYF